MTLEDGLSALDLSLSDRDIERLEGYLSLLSKWNRTYNLTAIDDMPRMVTHHLLDSLAVLPWLEGVATLADVGSGAGLPGIPLAICRPDMTLVSVESNQKKAAFQRQTTIELGLSNVSIHCGRIEQFTGHFDAVISRAFAELAYFAEQAGHLSGRLLAMKGACSQTEVDRLGSGWKVEKTVKLDVPGLDAERHLIVLGRS